MGNSNPGESPTKHQIPWIVTLLVRSAGWLAALKRHEHGMSHLGTMLGELKDAVRYLWRPSEPTGGCSCG